MLLREMKLRNSNKCNCGHEFSHKDIKPPIIQNTDYNFYGGRVKYYIKTKCPKCKKEVYLLLENYNNRDGYKVIDVAEDEQINTEVNSYKKIEESGNTEQFICDKCGKVCANKAGLTAHKRKCKNN